MDIYIASSWKNQHGVEMLTELLRGMGHKVHSFVENNHGENERKTVGGKEVPFEQWVWSEAGDQSFFYDTEGATKSDLVIYYGPSGQDAAAELAMAWHSGRKTVGLWAKGENLGLMRRLCSEWFTDFRQLLKRVELYGNELATNRKRKKAKLRKV